MLAISSFIPLPVIQLLTVFLIFINLDVFFSKIVAILEKQFGGCRKSFQTTLDYRHSLLTWMQIKCFSIQKKSNSQNKSDKIHSQNLPPVASFSSPMEYGEVYESWPTSQSPYLQSPFRSVRNNFLNKCQYTNHLISVRRKLNERVSLPTMFPSS